MGKKASYYLGQKSSKLAIVTGFGSDDDKTILI